MVIMLAIMALVGHYKLRKQVPVLAWTYSIFYPIVVAIVAYYAFYVIN